MTCLEAWMACWWTGRWVNHLSRSGLKSQGVRRIQLYGCVSKLEAIFGIPNFETHFYFYYLLKLWKIPIVWFATIMTFAAKASTHFRWPFQTKLVGRNDTSMRKDRICIIWLLDLEFFFGRARGEDEVLYSTPRCEEQNALYNLVCQPGSEVWGRAEKPRLWTLQRLGPSSSQVDQSPLDNLDNHLKVGDEPGLISCRWLVRACLLDLDFYTCIVKILEVTKTPLIDLLIPERRRATWKRLLKWTCHLHPLAYNTHDESNCNHL